MSVPGTIQLPYEPWNTAGFVAKIKHNLHGGGSLECALNSRIMVVALPFINTWDGITESCNAAWTFGALLLRKGSSDTVKQHLFAAFKHFYAAVFTSAATVVPLGLVFPKLVVSIHEDLGLVAADSPAGKIGGIRERLVSSLQKPAGLAGLTAAVLLMAGGAAYYLLTPFQTKKERFTPVDHWWESLGLPPSFLQH